MAPKDELYELNIGNILAGKFPEIFQKQMSLLLDNIRDQNTAADTVRKMSFEFTIKPSDDRLSAQISLKPALKLANIEPLGGTMFISKAEGTLKAYCRDIRQETMFEPPSAGNGVAKRTV